MPLTRTAGFPLQSIPYSETSKIFKLYTEKNGAISAIAKGIQRPKSALRDLLVPYGIFELVFSHNPRSELATLKDAHVSKAFSRLAQDALLQAAAAVHLEIYLRHLSEPEPSPSLFNLLSTQLSILDGIKNPLQSLPAAICDFLLQFSALSGFQPHLEKCGLCEQPIRKVDRYYFDFSMGTPFCRTCRSEGNPYSGPLPGQLFTWLGCLVRSGNYAGALSTNLMEEAEKVLLLFLSYHSHYRKPLKSYPVYRSLLSA